MQPWLVLRHIEHENLGTLTRGLDAHGIAYQYLDVFRNVSLPADIDGVGGLIVMGGPQGVYEQDRFPFIQPELRLIERAVRAGMPVIGICLGSQMLAAALGARVYASGKKEIGWYKVRSIAPGDPFTAHLPDEFIGFHWHGDTFELPQGAVRLFESDMFANQGFRWGRNVLALQFHFEVDRTMVKEWLADAGCQAEVSATPGITAESILRDTAIHGERLEQLSQAYFSHILRQLSSDMS